MISRTEIEENIVSEAKKAGYTHYVTKNIENSKVRVDDTDKEIRKWMKLNWQFDEDSYKKQQNYAYIGVTRTNKASEAVTGLLRMKATEGKDPAQTVYVDGNVYTLCGGKITDKFLGDYYLYQSYGSGVGAPMTAVDFGIVPYMKDAATALYAESSGTSTSDSAATLGCGSSMNYIYGYYNDASEYIDAVYIGSGDTVFEACSDLIAAGATKAILYDVRHYTHLYNKGNQKYTFIGYSTSKSTKNKDGSIKKAKGVRDIVFVTCGNGGADDKLLINGRDYRVARNGSGKAMPINPFEGTYIYYYTADIKVDIPLINKLGISERDRVPDSKETWENVLTADNKRYNLNEGIVSFLKDSGKLYLMDARAYLYCRRQSNADNYVKPGAAIVGGHSESSMTYGDLYIEPAG